MNRYTVWHTTGKFDGDAGFDDLDKAMAEFEHQKEQPGVIQVDITDNEPPEGFAPIHCIKNWYAMDDAKN